MAIPSVLHHSRVYTAHGATMLQIHIRIPVLSESDDSRFRTLFELTKGYAEDTLLPQIVRVYESLTSVSEKMRFPGYRYEHVWETEPLSSCLFAVTAKTVLTCGGDLLSQSSHTFFVDARSGQFVRGRKRTKGRKAHRP